ncbi:MAG: ATP-binding cassette domain-containing protein [Bacteroidia bacterium]
MNHTLEIESVLLEFRGRKILSDVCLKCETGKITGLLGRNGEGKSCLMNVIYGSLEPTNKIIRFDSINIENPYKDPGKLLYLPQFNFIPNSLTLRRVFRDFSVDFAEFEKMFPEFGSKYNSKIQSLSGGLIRVIELFIVLRSDTKFVLLDEPFTHIMPLHIEKFKQILEKEKNNKGILLTDHMYKHVIGLSDRLFVLTQGKTHLIKNIKEIESLGYANLIQPNP